MSESKLVYVVSQGEVREYETTRETRRSFYVMVENPWNVTERKLIRLDKCREPVYCDVKDAAVKALSQASEERNKAASDVFLWSNKVSDLRYWLPSLEKQRCHDGASPVADRAESSDSEAWQFRFSVEKVGCMYGVVQDGRLVALVANKSLAETVAQSLEEKGVTVSAL